MRMRSILISGFVLAVPACFSPNTSNGGDTDNSGDTTASTSSTDTSTTDGGPGGDPDAGPTTGSTSGTTPTSTTDDPSSGPSDSSSTGAPEPFCGDGNVDDGEECDDGDENGPGGACLEVCVLNVCGDGDMGPREGCDAGSDNALEVGACAPDCSGVIEERVITIGAGFEDGALGANPVAAADGLCDPGFLAMFAVPGVRIATTAPNDSVGAIDWVLHPYTAYTRMNGTLVWITDSVPLLGVRNGLPQALVNPIDPPCTGTCLIEGPVITGMQANWTSPAPLDCNDWMSGSSTVSTSYGDHESTTEFLLSATIDCEFVPDGGVTLNNARVYCIEQ